MGKRPEYRVPKKIHKWLRDRGMQIKSIRWYHIISVRCLLSEKRNKYQRGCSAQTVGMYTGTVTMVSSTKLPCEIKNRTTMWPSKSTSYYLSHRNNAIILKRYLTSMFKLFTIVTIQKQLGHPPTDEWTKICYRHIPNGTL